MPKQFVEPKLLRLDIQFFAEGDPTPEPTPNLMPNPSPEPQPQGAAISLEAVQAFVNDDDGGKKWLQSLTDTRVTDAIKTYETKTFPGKLEEEISKRFPAETTEQKQLRELQLKFEQLETEKTRESLKNRALSIANEKALPTQLVDYFIGQDEEATLKNMGNFEEVFAAAVQAGVSEKFKTGGREPQTPALPGTQLTKEAIEKMTSKEINENWAEVEKFLKTN